MDARPPQHADELDDAQRGRSVGRKAFSRTLRGEGRVEASGCSFGRSANEPGRPARVATAIADSDPLRGLFRISVGPPHRHALVDLSAVFMGTHAPGAGRRKPADSSRRPTTGNVARLLGAAYRATNSNFTAALRNGARRDPGQDDER